MAYAQIVRYPGPEGIEAADDYVVEVNGLPLFVYNARVNPLRVPDKDGYPEFAAFASFDFAGEVTVKVTSTKAIDFVDIRPKSSGIVPITDGNTASFRLSQPQKLTLEIDGNLHRVLHVFANPLEIDAPPTNDPNVLYYGPGVHDAGTILLESDTTVYLAGGAYVYGIVRGEGAQGATVRGRGILDGSKEPWPRGSVHVVGCHGLTVRDIVVLDSSGWTFKIDASDNVTIENIKIICRSRNSDGINLCSTRNATVHDCFIRNWDDGVCVKGLDKGNSTHTRVTNCVIWSDAAQSLEIGYETRMETITDVLFRDIDIIHHLMPGYLVMTIHNGDRALISDVRFENIRIEDTVAPLFDVWVGKSHWNKDAQPGSVRQVSFKNVSLYGGVDPRATASVRVDHAAASSASYLSSGSSRVQGYDEDHRVADVTFENLHMLGQYVGDLDAAGLYLGEHVSGIRFELPSDGAAVGSFRTSPAIATGAPVTIDFDASESFSQAAEIISYGWSLGDGAAAEGVRVSHTYAHAGNYTVSLTVRDATGREASATRIVSILPLRPADPLVSMIPGLRYAYYEGDFDFGTDYATLTAVENGTCAGLDTSPRRRDQSYAFVYTGYIEVPVDGVYGFSASMEFWTGYNVEAGGAIYIGGVQVSANNSGVGWLGLQAGLHPIEVVAFGKSYDKTVDFTFGAFGSGAQPLNTARLYYI